MLGHHIIYLYIGLHRSVEFRYVGSSHYIPVYWITPVRRISVCWVITLYTCILNITPVRRISVCWVITLYTCILDITPVRRISVCWVITLYPQIGMNILSYQQNRQTTDPYLTTQTSHLHIDLRIFKTESLQSIIRKQRYFTKQFLLARILKHEFCLKYLR